MASDFALVSIRATPRSRQSKIELVGEIVRVWVTAAPTDGQANEAVCRLLAKTLAVAPSRVTIARGASSRDKTIRVDGLPSDVVMARLRGER